LCFSVVHPSSFENLKWWIIELKKHCPNTPLILCGTKIDLREDPTVIAHLEETNEKPISKKNGQKKAKEIKARAYLECSAKEIHSVTSVFKQSVKIVWDKEKKMWADVHKKAKKEDKIEEKAAKKIKYKKSDVEHSP